VFDISIRSPQRTKAGDKYYTGKHLVSILFLDLGLEIRRKKPNMWATCRSLVLNMAFTLVFKNVKIHINDAYSYHTM
jgi:hypothetical protein